MRSLEDVLKELKEAEKEYAKKCEKYGIEASNAKKKEKVLICEDNQENKEG